MLAPGSTIALIAPSFPVPDSTIRGAEKWVRDWGFNPRVFSVSTHDDLYAGPTKERADALISALYSDDVAALWALRGGAGMRQLIPFLKGRTAPQTHKWILGFSDITALLMHAVQAWGWPVLHGPNLSRLVKNDYTPETVQMVKDVLMGHKTRLIYPLAPLNDVASNAMPLIGTVTGGNLSVIQYSIGTPSHPILPAGHFLFLEDVNEQAYRLDQILEQYNQAGLFENAQAILLGDFSFDISKGNQNGDDEKFMIETVLKNFAASCPHPVYRMPGIGHGPRNAVLPFGVLGHITNTQNGFFLDIKV